MQTIVSFFLILLHQFERLFSFGMEGKKEMREKSK